MKIQNLRKNSLAVFAAGMLLILIGAVINPFMWMIGLGIFLAGTACATGGLVMLTSGLGKDNQDPTLVDEYHLTHIADGRAAALKVAYIGVGLLMTVLLFVPLLVLASIPSESWAEVVRSVGMIAGGLVFLIAFTQPFVIATRITADETADELEDSELSATR